MKISLIRTLVCASVSMACFAQTSGPATYAITDLGPVGALPGQAFFINDHDVVTVTAVEADGNSHAELSYKGYRYDLSKPGLGGLNSLAFVVNESGQAVGMAETASGDPHAEDFCGFKSDGLPTRGTTCLPFLWQDGVMTPLVTLGGNNGVANWINNRSQVVGIAETAVPDPTCPFPLAFQFKPVLWSIGSVQALPLPSGDLDGVAISINEHGQVVGASGQCGNYSPFTLSNLVPTHPLLWQNGVATDLGTLGGSGNLGGNIALGINNLGQAVGNSDLAGDTASHAFLWTKEKRMQDLGALPGDAISTALAINDSGQIVGVSVDANFNTRATIWLQGKPADLNSLIPASSPLYLVLACAINSRGEFTGLAIDKNTGEAHTYIATPRPTTADFDFGASASSKPMQLSEGIRQLIRHRMPHVGMGARRNILH